MVSSIGTMQFVTRGPHDRFLRNTGTFRCNCALSLWSWCLSSAVVGGGWRVLPRHQCLHNRMTQCACLIDCSVYMVVQVAHCSCHRSRVPCCITAQLLLGMRKSSWDFQYISMANITFCLHSITFRVNYLKRMKAVLIPVLAMHGCHYYREEGIAHFTFDSS